ncbi:MAG: hypothetical protein IPN08_13110 [Bacteroidales bacterium]|jgi:hypothetical protein|nr:hypothetical protein [Bacteroidales bacterium]MBK9358306.1 hypothetical protein [Bacteroidales bacterium]
MKKATLILGILLSVMISNAQTKNNRTEKSPGLMMGLDTTLIKMEYSRFNNYSETEFWERILTPDRLVYYCVKSDNKNQVNVAHIYEFDANGINDKYITVAAQEKIKFACDYLNNIALNNKYIYEYQGVNSNNQGVWVSSKKIKDLSDCNCGNVVVTVTSNIPSDNANSIIDNCPVKVGRSGELLTIVYTPIN